MTTEITGSLGYAVDLGRIYYIQLNDNPADNVSSKVTPYVINSYVDSAVLPPPVGLSLPMATYSIKLNSTDAWLENRLEYAAQNNKIIMINKHRPDLSNSIIYLLNKYNVSLRFSGHYHYGLGKDSNNFFNAGSSANKDMLTLEIDYDKNRYKVVSIKNLDFKKQSILAEMAIVKHPSYFPNGVLPHLPSIISVKNQGGYTGKASVSYLDPATKKIVFHESGTMSLGNTYKVTIPIGGSAVNASFINYTGLVWEPTKVVFEKNNLKGNVCFTTWGTTLSPDYAMNEGCL